MNIKERFLQVKTELDANSKLAAGKPEIWDYTILSNGFVVNEGVSSREMDGFLERCPVEVPHVLKDFWRDANGFHGGWGYDWEWREGEFTTLSLSFGLMPMVEAFGGERFIDDMCAKTESDQLLQWTVLDAESYALSAEFHYEDPSVMTEDAFENILRNCIFLEFFSHDMSTYTLLKLDAEENEPSLYLACEKAAIYPLSLNLTEYLDAMFGLRGIMWPWPLLFVRRDNVEKSNLSDFDRTIERARGVAEYLDLKIDFGKYEA